MSFWFWYFLRAPVCECESLAFHGEYERVFQVGEAGLVNTLPARGGVVVANCDAGVGAKGKGVQVWHSGGVVWFDRRRGRYLRASEVNIHR